MASLKQNKTKKSIGEFLWLNQEKRFLNTCTPHDLGKSSRSTWQWGRAVCKHRCLWKEIAVCSNAPLASANTFQCLLLLCASTWPSSQPHPISPWKPLSPWHEKCTSESLMANYIKGKEVQTSNKEWLTAQALTEAITPSKRLFFFNKNVSSNLFSDKVCVLCPPVTPVLFTPRFTLSRAGPDHRQSRQPPT